MSASQDAASAGEHTPVLYQNVLSALQLRPGERYIDGTVGAGGHARGILAGSSPDGMLLGLDRDPAALTIAAHTLAPFEGRYFLRRSSYAQMATRAEELGWEKVFGVLLDLGLSSMQLADPARGFSFLLEGPLDMRFDPETDMSAAELVNTLDETELVRILSEYGEEPRSRTVARAIIASRPIWTTGQLAEIASRNAARTRRGLHPATRTFQALRIAVNHELETLQAGLAAALGLLKPGGRVAVIAFHSLEDRIVKQFFNRERQDCICPPEQPVCTCGHKATLRLITRRPERPSETEIKQNPRARSARLRVAERLPLA
ncbi:MAG: 16S rRNA (cytosine(1402)-N(4))-methyltransferase RsmH [Anaerolineales bacterium]